MTLICQWRLTGLSVGAGAGADAEDFRHVFKFLYNDVARDVAPEYPSIKLDVTSYHTILLPKFFLGYIWGAV